MHSEKPRRELLHNARAARKVENAGRCCERELITVGRQDLNEIESEVRLKRRSSFRSFASAVLTMVELSRRTKRNIKQRVTFVKRARMRRQRQCLAVLCSFTLRVASGCSVTQVVNTASDIFSNISNGRIFRNSCRCIHQNRFLKVVEDMDVGRGGQGRPCPLDFEIWYCAINLFQ